MSSGSMKRPNVYERPLDLKISITRFLLDLDCLSMALPFLPARLVSTATQA